MLSRKSLRIFVPCAVFAVCSIGPSIAQQTEEVTSTSEEKKPEEANRLSREALEAAAAGNIAFQAGDFEAAAMKFQLMLSLAPDSPVPRVNLASAEFRRGNLEAAEKLLREALRIDPGPARVWTTLGIVCFNQGKLDSALASLSRAIEIDGTDPRARNYLGATLAGKDWLMGAEAELRQAIKLDPLYAEAHFNLSLVYLRRDPPALELARRHYQQAIELGAAPDKLVESQLEQ